MASTHAEADTMAVPMRVVAGAAAGLVAGLPLGVIMQTGGVIPMVADLIGSTSPGVGWLVHLFNSALFGAIFALLFAQWASRMVAALGLGLLYGIAWWVVGALGSCRPGSA